MANLNNMRAQSKLRKLVIDPEATPGTYETVDANSITVPQSAFIAPSMDRGKGMIDRTATLDGYAGDVASVRGSSAWSLASEFEIHDSTTEFNYWVLGLLSAGFEANRLTDTPSAGNTTMRLTPSNKTYAGFTAGSAVSPCTLSATVIQGNNQSADYAQRLRGVTSVASFILETGAIAKMALASKGLVVTASSDADDFLDNSDVDISQFGNVTGNWTSPFVVKNINLEILDADSNPRNIEYLNQ